MCTRTMYMYMHMLMRDADMYLYMYGHSVYQNVNILHGYIRVCKSPKFSIPSYFSAKTLWVPAHCKISSENFVGARAPRTRRSAPHALKSCTAMASPKFRFDGMNIQQKCTHQRLLKNL